MTVGKDREEEGMKKQISLEEDSGLDLPRIHKEPDFEMNSMFFNKLNCMFSELNHHLVNLLCC